MPWIVPGHTCYMITSLFSVTKVVKSGWRMTELI